jgi:hypothetical protein
VRFQNDLGFIVCRGARAAALNEMETCESLAGKLLTIYQRWANISPEMKTVWAAGVGGVVQAAHDLYERIRSPESKTDAELAKLRYEMAFLWAQIGDQLTEKLGQNRSPKDKAWKLAAEAAQSWVKAARVGVAFELVKAKQGRGDRIFPASHPESAEIADAQAALAKAQCEAAQLEAKVWQAYADWAVQMQLPTS